MVALAIPKARWELGTRQDFGTRLAEREALGAQSRGAAQTSANLP